MRKLIVSMNITLDGYMAGPDSELDWHFNRWTSEMAQAQCEQLSRVETLLLGRTTYTAMAGYWVGVKSDMSFPREDMAFAELMHTRTKVVVSQSQPNLYWDNSVQLKGNLAGGIRSLKAKKGGDIIVYGSGQLVSSLNRLGLIDQYVLWLHPVLLGKGKPLFREIKALMDMRLSKVKEFGGGVVLLQYDKL